MLQLLLCVRRPRLTYGCRVVVVDNDDDDDDDDDNDDDGLYTLAFVKSMILNVNYLKYLLHGKIIYSITSYSGRSSFHYTFN
jgi:hypothetical protein